MKILQITKYYYPFRGGIEQVTQDVANSLEKYENIVVAFNHEKGNKTDIVDNAKVYRIGCQAKIASQPIALSYGKNLKKIFEIEKPELVIFHYPNPLAGMSLVKYLPKDAKLIVYWHTDIVKQKLLKKLFHGQTIKLLDRAFKIIATSPNYVDGSEFLPNYKDKIVIIPNCVNVERFAENDKIKELAKEIKAKNKDKTICFAIGRHTLYKGMGHLVAASKYLDDNYKIYIGGVGDLTEELKKQAEGDVKIEFVGKLSDEQLAAYYRACDVFCFPSITKNEAFGIALAEGMYFEKPAVTFTIEGSGVNYVNLNNETGIEVENCNDAAFADAIKKLATNKELAKKYGKNAKERVENNFMFAQFKNNVNALLKRIK